MICFWALFEPELTIRTECGASDWRRALVPRDFGSVPRWLHHSLGRPYVTRVLGVVDRTVNACPITCSPRHLTSHLFHSYISTHSLRSHWPFPFCVILGRYRLRAWVLRQWDRHRLVATLNRIMTETSHEFELKTIVPTCLRGRGDFQWMSCIPTALLQYLKITLMKPQEIFNSILKFREVTSKRADAQSNNCQLLFVKIG